MSGMRNFLGYLFWAHLGFMAVTYSFSRFLGVIFNPLRRYGYTLKCTFSSNSHTSESSLTCIGAPYLRVCSLVEILADLWVPLFKARMTKPHLRMVWVTTKYRQLTKNLLENVKNSHEMLSIFQENLRKHISPWDRALSVIKLVTRHILCLWWIRMSMLTA